MSQYQNGVHVDYRGEPVHWTIGSSTAGHLQCCGAGPSWDCGPEVNGICSKAPSWVARNEDDITCIECNKAWSGKLEAARIVR